MQEGKGWNPYLAGGLSGIVSILSVWVTGHYLGASTTFVRASGMVEKIFAPEKLTQLEYFVRHAPKIDWQFMVVIGIMIGAFAAAVTSGSFRLQAVPDMWRERFGPSVAKRAAVAFVGGIIALFGVRLADGCPSGHGLSGALQLAVSGYIALIAFFVGGVIVARIIYGKGDEK
ncbi:YeeE/YedE thiosulfate transporter family protein [Anaeroselena agilis]|uniref:YeeE/YedE thiosulfate transporter family protein n=1 Tax=Anaeroselena agilis TaxID=3063788 RepID=A0ABU3P1L1_9FIRM|nr:YeeE/YedE thiosulfate transporter family protein [Selenomonadales bacterium 4137-cl]